LNQDGNTEGIHGEAGGIDLDAEDVDDTLSLFKVLLGEGFDDVGGKEGRGVDSRL
jgi:hypothetical protein